tara:strand:- start:1461 stop:1562 length:102 start_codon:yes stop_codon:yes gene_type:complete
MKKCLIETIRQKVVVGKVKMRRQYYTLILPPEI